MLAYRFLESTLRSIDNKDILCIPLCDGVHFQGYIINVKERKITKVENSRKSYGKAYC